MDKDADAAWTQAASKKKSEFALTYSIHKTDWVIPRYIKDGLTWLASPAVPNAAVAHASVSGSTNVQ